MSRLEMLGYIWIFMSLSLSMGLYKLEISKRVTDEEYEYIKRHRAFGNLTKYLSIIAIISILLLNFNFLVYKDYEFMSRFGGAWGFFVLFIICTGFFQKRDSLYYKRGIIGIISILFGAVGAAYAFKDIFFKQYNTALILVTIKRYLFNPAAGVLAIGVNTGYGVYAE